MLWLLGFLSVDQLGGGVVLEEFAFILQNGLVEHRHAGCLS